MENIGTNVLASVDGDKLTLTVDLSKEHGRSKSGKTVIIATTQGNKAVPGAEFATIGLNIYKRPA